MNLVVHIPCRSIDDSLNALSFARRAPTFTVEWVNDERVAIAIFPSLPVGIDLAVQLVGESLRLSGAWASVNAKPFSSLVRLWQRLVCYRGSLGVADPIQYCHEKATQFNALVSVSCEGHSNPVPCQFISMPYVRTSSEGPTVEADRQYELASTLAEVDWCPRLNLRSADLATSRAIPPSGSNQVRV